MTVIIILQMSAVTIMYALITMGLWVYYCKKDIDKHGGGQDGDSLEFHGLLFVIRVNRKRFRVPFGQFFLIISVHSRLPPNDRFHQRKPFRICPAARSGCSLHNRESRSLPGCSSIFRRPA